MFKNAQNQNPKPKNSELEKILYCIQYLRKTLKNDLKCLNAPENSNLILNTNFDILFRFAEFLDSSAEPNYFFDFIQVNYI